MRYDNKNGCKHQNEVKILDDIFILCRLREPFIIRCKKGTCEEHVRLEAI